MSDRDIIILRQIIKYSGEIYGIIERFELDCIKFKKDYIPQYAMSMCILQIGELSGKLTDEFKINYNEMPWRDIVSVRNRVVHGYENTDMDILWDIAAHEISELKKYCENILKANEC